MSSESNEPMECPLCMEEMDATDRNFKPCKCGYQVCLWCWRDIKQKAQGKCPNCRAPYNDTNIEFTAVDPAEIQKQLARGKDKKKTKKASAGPAPIPPVTTDRGVLQQVRVMQRNLVYVVGLPPSHAKEDVLRKKEWFGRFGRIIKIAVNRKQAVVMDKHSSYSAYVTFKREKDAGEAIKAIHGCTMDGRIIRATYGTTKYCSYFLRHLPCNNPGCLYLHDLARPEDCFTKEDLTNPDRMEDHGYSAAGRPLDLDEDDDDQNMPTEVKVPSTDSLQRKPLASPHAADPPGLGRSASVDYSSSMNGTAAAASAAPPMRRAQSVGTPVPQEDVGSEGTSSSPYAAIAGAPPPQPLVPPDLSAEAFPPLVSSAPSQPAPTPARVRSAANNKSIDATSPIQIQKTQPLAVEESVELKTEPVPVSTNTTPASSLITPAPAPAVAPGPSIAPPPAAALGLAPGVGSDIGLGFGPSPFAPLAAVSNTSSSGPIGPSRGRAVGPPPGIRPPPGFSEPQSSSVSSPIGFNATGTSMLGLNAFSDSSWGFPDRFSSGGGLMRTNGFLGPDFSGQNSAESSRWSLNRLLSDLPPLAPRAPVSSQSQWEPGTSDADAMQLLQGGIPNLNPSPLTHSSATGRSRYAFVSEENDESGSALRPGPSFSHSVSPVAELDWQASLRAVLPPTATVNFGPSLRSEPPAVGISGLQQQLDTLATGSAIPPPSRSPTAIGSQISRFPTTAFPSASSADLSSSLFTRSDSLNGAPPTDPLFGAPGASAPSGSRLSLWSSAAMDASPPFQGNRFNGSLSSVSLDPVLNAPSRTAPIGSRPLLDPAIVAFKPPGALGGGLPDSFGLSMGFPGSNVGRASPTSTDPFRTGSRSSPIQQLMDARLSPQDPVFNPQPSAPKSRLPPGFENAQPILNLATPAPVSATPAPTPAPAAAAVIAASASATSAATSTDSPRKAPSTKGKGKGTTVVVAGGTGKKNTKNAPSTNGVGKKQSAPQMIST